MTRTIKARGIRKIRETKNKLSNMKRPPLIPKNLKGFVVRSIPPDGTLTTVVVAAVSTLSASESVVSDTAVMAVEWFVVFLSAETVCRKQKQHASSSRR